jgi:hypothetical protein
MSLPPYQISLKSTKRFRNYWWGTDRQTGDVISLLSFSESGLKRNIKGVTREDHVGVGSTNSPRAADSQPRVYMEPSNRLPADPL